ncbi:MULTISPECIES: DUF1835 domain-containing protein [Falsihalocynthiibacter]|uniref:DUF1835 domain-containing protein n=1 Tax=Falsihalocynthiibacter TaxID=2854182 RepID=UPI003000FAE3
MNKPVRINLVLGGSAGGNLRAAFASHEMTERVHVFDDDLSHGPLNNLEAREAYMKDIYMHYGLVEESPIPCLADLEHLSRQLNLDDTQEVCIWGGDNASERVFLAMACHGLRHFNGSVTRVGSTGLTSMPYIGAQTPDLLASLRDERVTIDPHTRTAQAKTFLHHQNTGGILRRWEANEIVDVAPDYYDTLLTKGCPKDWTSAARVVGTAMGACDEQNLLNDVFLSGRLQHLIACEMIEASGPQTSLRDYVVRREQVS